MTAIHASDRLMLGPYRLEQEIGRGGMGIVYRATDVRLNRVVALKVVQQSVAETAGISPDELRMKLRQEAQLAARVVHPSVVTVYSYDEVGQDALIAMELVEGTTLHDCIARGQRWSPADTVMLLAQAADGVAAAHAIEIVHRDLKPGNLMLSMNGRVKVLDFGIAKATSLTSTAAYSRVTFGTVQYMSPEQVLGKPVTFASDVWALGVIGYEMLTGRSAFGDGAAVTIGMRVAAEDPVCLRSEEEALSLFGDVGMVLRRSLSKSPVNRYRDAAAFRDALLATAARASRSVVAIDHYWETAPDEAAARATFESPYSGPAEPIPPISSSRTYHSAPISERLLDRKPLVTALGLVVCITLAAGAWYASAAARTVSSGLGSGAGQAPTVQAPVAVVDSAAAAPALAPPPATLIPDLLVMVPGPMDSTRKDSTAMQNPVESNRAKKEVRVELIKQRLTGIRVTPSSAVLLPGQSLTIEVVALSNAEIIPPEELVSVRARNGDANVATIGVSNESVVVSALEPGTTQVVVVVRGPAGDQMTSVPISVVVRVPEAAPIIVQKAAPRLALPSQQAPVAAPVVTAAPTRNESPEFAPNRTDVAGAIDELVTLMVSKAWTRIPGDVPSQFRDAVDRGGRVTVASVTVGAPRALETPFVAVLRVTYTAGTGATRSKQIVMDGIASSAVGGAQLRVTAYRQGG